MVAAYLEPGTGCLFCTHSTWGENFFAVSPFRPVCFFCNIGLTLLYKYLFSSREPAVCKCWGLLLKLVLLFLGTFQKHYFSCQAFENAILWINNANLSLAKRPSSIKMPLGFFAKEAIFETSKALQACPTHVPTLYHYILPLARYCW